MIYLFCYNVYFYEYGFGFKKLIKFGNIVFCKNYDIGLDL